MLDNREDYTFLPQNVMKRIAIKGMPYPVRSQKLIVMGEDVAYLREAILERMFLRDGLGSEPPGNFNGVILFAKRDEMRADWLKRAIDVELSQTENVWMDADAVETYELPSGAAISITGTGRTYRRPDEAGDAIDNAAQDIRAKETALKNELENLKTQYDTDCGRIKDKADEDEVEATAARTSRLTQIENDLKNDLKTLEDEHKSAVDAIIQEYNKAMEDPDADHEEAQRKYESAMSKENRNYAFALERRNNEASRDRDDAHNQWRKAVWDAQSEMYEEALRLWNEYLTDVNDAKGSAAQYISAQQAERNAIVATTEKEDSYDRFISFSGEMSASDGIEYSDVMDGIAADRQTMRIRQSCLTQYLDTTPGITGSANEAYVKYAPDGNATMRAYADLERLRCLSRASDFGSVYRDAFILNIVHSDGSISKSYYQSTAVGEALETRNYIRHKEEWQEYPQGETGWSEYVFSNDRFSVYYGRRKELDRISAIYVTAMVLREELLTVLDGDGNASTQFHRTVGFNRILLRNDGIQAASKLERIDSIRDKYARMWADCAAIRDKAITKANDDYYNERAQADVDYNDAIADAEKVYNDALIDADMAYVNTIMPQARTTNDRIAIIERSDMSDEDKRTLIQAAIRQYESVESSANAVRNRAERDANTAKNNAISNAEQVRQEAYDAALNKEVDAEDEAKAQYAESTENFSHDEFMEVEEVKNEVQAERDAAAQKRTDARNAAYAEYNNALATLHTEYEGRLKALTVDGRTIQQNPQYIDPDENDGIAVTDEAYERMTSSERQAYWEVHDGYSSGKAHLWNVYEEAYDAADEAYWNDIRAIENIREDARCKWSFAPEAVDSDEFHLVGDGSHYQVRLRLGKILHFDVVYEPKSLTGEDFEAYYAELEE